MHNRLKQSLKQLSKLGLEVNYALDSGLSFAGMNLARAKRPLADRSAAALEHCLALQPKTVLDVGSGGGQHAAAFARNGAAVTCVDYGTSIYATDPKRENGLDVIEVDFNRWKTDQTFDLVWASHVLEHQRNPGVFIDNLVARCTPDGHIAITVPFPHRHLWGGHLSLWTPGTLAYNVVLAGIDCSAASLFYGYRETSMVFQPIRVELPELTYDSGDIERLQPFLPRGVYENGDSWI